jgi:outer membrane protein TolC
MGKVKGILFGVLLFVLLGVCSFNVYGQVYFTYEQALAASLENVLALQDLDARIREHKDALEELMDNLREWRWENWPNESREIFRRQITEIERQIRRVELSRGIAETNIERALRGALVTVSVTAHNIQILEERLTLSEERLLRTGVLRRFGMASANELIAAEQNVRQLRMDLFNLRVTAFNQQQALNYIMQQPLYQETTVTFEIELTGLPEDLDKYIQTAITRSPGIAQLQITVDSRADEMDVFAQTHRDRGARERSGAWNLSDDDLQESWDSLVRAHERAVRERGEAVRAMESTLRAAYNGIVQMQNQETAARLDLEWAEAELETAQRQLALGRVTAFDVNNASFTVFNRELSLQNIHLQIWLAEFSLANP